MTTKKSDAKTAPKKSTKASTPKNTSKSTPKKSSQKTTPKKESTSDKNTLPIEKEKKEEMNEHTIKEKPSFIKPMIPNYVLGNRDCKIWCSAVKKGKKDEEGKNISPDLLKFHAIGNNKEICEEIIARLWELGRYVPEYEGQLQTIDEIKLCSIYMIPKDMNTQFRNHYKKVKENGGFNAPGIAIQAEKEKKEAEEKKAALKKKLEEDKAAAEKAEKEVAKKMGEDQKTSSLEELKKTKEEAKKKLVAEVEAKKSAAETFDGKKRIQ